MSKYHGTYGIDAETYTVVIEFSYYWDNGTWEQPPEDELTIQSVTYNGVDITDFFWDYVIDNVEELVYEYAREHRPHY